MTDDPFSIADESASDAGPDVRTVCQFTPCAVCGELVLFVDSWIDRQLGGQVTCALCLRAARGDDGKASPEIREIGRKNFESLFEG
jgi:hypothetical protein